MGIGTAAGVAIGQSLGAQDIQSVRRVVGSAVAFVALFSTLVAVVGFVLTPKILDWIDTPDEVRAYTLTHLRLTCISMPSVFTFIVMMMMLRGSGDARTPFFFALVYNRIIRPDLRPDGVFLGERDYENDPMPEFIGARPDDLSSLMQGLITTNARMRDDACILSRTATDVYIAA
jgi:hypothetical protein